MSDHKYENNILTYNPDNAIMKWLDKEYKGNGLIPSELIPMYEAIMFNDDIKLYLNAERYQSKQLEPYSVRGRINTMGAIFAVCASESLLSRIELSDMLIKGRGTPRIFPKAYDYGGKLITPMTGGIVSLEPE